MAPAQNPSHESHESPESVGRGSLGPSPRLACSPLSVNGKAWARQDSDTCHRASCDREGRRQNGARVAFGEGQSWDLNVPAEQRHTAGDIKDIGQTHWNRWAKVSVRDSRTK